jgi:SAM-dependent methyltransferase
MPKIYNIYILKEKMFIYSFIFLFCCTLRGENDPSLPVFDGYYNMCYHSANDIITENYCPICKKQSYFEEFGNKLNRRIRVKCPNCGSLERHRLLYLYLVQKTGIFHDNLSLLHFAPEKCLSSEFEKCKNLNYVTADLYQPAMLKLDLTNINLPDECFDCVICFHVLEHVNDDLAAMREIYRILKPGGWAILNVPLSSRQETFENKNIILPQDRFIFYGQEDHVRLYGIGDYHSRLEKAGFIVTIDKFVTNLNPNIISEYRLCSKEDIYFCIKT